MNQVFVTGYGFAPAEQQNSEVQPLQHTLVTAAKTITNPGFSAGLDEAFTFVKTLRSLVSLIKIVKSKTGVKSKFNIGNTKTQDAAEGGRAPDSCLAAVVTRVVVLGFACLPFPPSQLFTEIPASGASVVCKLAREVHHEESHRNFRRITSNLRLCHRAGKR